MKADVSVKIFPRGCTWLPCVVREEDKVAVKSAEETQQVMVGCLGSISSKWLSLRLFFTLI